MKRNLQKLDEEKYRYKSVMVSDINFKITDWLQMKRIISRESGNKTNLSKRKAIWIKI